MCVVTHMYIISHSYLSGFSLVANKEFTKSSWQLHHEHIFAFLLEYSISKLFVSYTNLKYLLTKSAIELSYKGSFIRHETPPGGRRSLHLLQSVQKIQKGEGLQRSVSYRLRVFRSTNFSNEQTHFSALSKLSLW